MTRERNPFLGDDDMELSMSASCTDGTVINTRFLVTGEDDRVIITHKLLKAFLDLRNARDEKEYGSAQ